MLLATSALPRYLIWPSSPPRPPRCPAEFLSFSSVVHHHSSDHFQVFSLNLGPRVDCGSARDPLHITSFGENIFMEPDNSLIHLMKNLLRTFTYGNPNLHGSKKKMTLTKKKRTLEN